MSDAFAACEIPGLPRNEDGQQYWPVDTPGQWPGHDGRRGTGRANLSVKLAKGEDAQGVFLRWEAGKFVRPDFPIDLPAGAVLAEFVGGALWGGSGYRAVCGAAMPGPMTCETVDALDVFAEFQQKKPWRTWVVFAPKGGA